MRAIAPTTPSRGSIVSAFLLAILASAVSSHATVAIVPAVPWSALPVVVRVLPDGDPACLHWTLRGQSDFTISLVADPAPPHTGCPAEGQALELGTLPAGRYHLEARRADGSVWSEVYFRVTSVPLTLFADEAVIRPPRPTTADPVDIVLSLGEPFSQGDVFSCFSLLGVGNVAVTGDTVTISMFASIVQPECNSSPPRQHGFVVRLPPLTQGLKHLVVLATHDQALQRDFTVEVASSAVLLGERFEAQLSWTDPAGAVHDARPQRLSDGSAVYSFADPANVELTVKALDGRPVNGKFWIFAASLTDQPWELHVVDRASAGCATGHCLERVYNGVRHLNANVLDTHAFDP